MSNRFSFNNKNKQKASASQEKLPEIISLLDMMVDGREFESLSKVGNARIDVFTEIKKALKDISDIRQRPIIAYASNIISSKIKASISIDASDELPFAELVNTVPDNFTEVDVVIITPGGLATQVVKFVDKLRRKFDNVSFILPDMAMSAGTILAMSGDEIIMTNNSYIGPIDPQVPNKDGRFVPAQGILTVIEEIQQRGEASLALGQQPNWTDLQILRQIEPKDIGNAVNASKYSIELVENYLNDYKFRTWTEHSTNGNAVTADEKRTRANQIAGQLCNHSLWKSHARGITREVARDVCNLKIIHSESIEGLDRAIKRLAALYFWIFENTPIYKTFLSEYLQF